MKRFYLLAEKIWFHFPQKTRFLLVGGFNTVFAYLFLNFLNIFFGICLQNTLSPVMIANLALIVQYILTVNVSVITMRYYVFQSHGNFYKEWLKAWSVYIFLYLINVPVLTFMMIVLGLSAWLAQGIYIIFSTILTFWLHKHYSFKKAQSTNSSKVACIE